jgi:hypothetical protein
MADSTLAGGAGASGFTRARGGVDARAARRPHPHFPFGSMLILAKPESGKSITLQWILMFDRTVKLLRSFYAEVIVIGNGTRDGETVGWQWMRQLHGIDSSNVSANGFFRLFGTMTVDMWLEMVVGRQIDGLRLVICDDTATNPIGAAWSHQSHTHTHTHRPSHQLFARVYPHDLG